MLGLLADHNVKRQVAHLVGICKREPYRAFWESMDLEVHSFDELSISIETSDTVIWRLCQKREIVLVTGNRNKDGEDSLEAVIQRENEASSLPVLTIGDPQRVLKDGAYADMAAYQMLEYLFEIDRVRGAGRLFIPRTP